eukprot:227928-Amphidinium_carterae.1
MRQWDASHIELGVRLALQVMHGQMHTREASRKGMSSPLITAIWRGSPIWRLWTRTPHLRFLGYAKLLLRTAGEPAILDLRMQLAAQLRVRHGMQVTEDTAGDSQANGLAEGAVRDMKACIRTLYCALQQTYGRLSPKHMVLAFL